MGAVEGGGDRAGGSVSLHVYVTHHIHSQTVCEAFARGADAILCYPPGLRPGADAIAMYGRLRGLDPILTAARRMGIDWYYIDRGYIGATAGKDYSGYFRVTRNELQSDGTGRPNFARFNRLRLSIKDWRRYGTHILVCPPGKVYAELNGFDAARWTADTVAKLKRISRRPVRIREKPYRGRHTTPLAHDLRDCWAMVVHSSNVAVEAALAGIPVFPTHRCAVSAISGGPLEQIESPRMTNDRAEWAAVLAAQQWTLDEMRSGVCWSELTEEPCHAG